MYYVGSAGNEVQDIDISVAAVTKIVAVNKMDVCIDSDDCIRG
jgi:putative protein kinase ArgK-like GTPase of G3E family